MRARACELTLLPAGVAVGRDRAALAPDDRVALPAGRPIRPRICCCLGTHHLAKTGPRQNELRAREREPARPGEEPKLFAPFAVVRQDLGGQTRGELVGHGMNRITTLDLIDGRG
jgi:hypothetical protein